MTNRVVKVNIILMYLTVIHVNNTSNKIKSLNLSNSMFVGIILINSLLRILVLRVLINN